MEAKIISDRNLLKKMKVSDVQNISELFSAGKFQEIIDSYFAKKKKDKKESIPIDLFAEFNSSDNNIKIQNKTNINSNYSAKNNNEKLKINSKIDNHFETELNLISSNSSNNLSLFPEDDDFIINTPNKPNNNLFNSKSDYKDNPYMGKIGIIEDYYNSVNDEKEFDYNLIEQFEDDKYTQQILLTIVIYCLLRIKNEIDLRSIFTKYNISFDNSIFPLILLKAKFYFKINSISQCLDICSQAIEKYNDFKFNNTKEQNSIIYNETFNQEFTYFNNVFNYLFEMNNIDSKIKKLYYEQKFFLYHLGFYSEGFKLLIELYNKYQNDVQIQFELGKDSIYLSKYDIFKEMFEILQKSVKQENNENKRATYLNYYIYLQGLSFLAQQKIENARNCFTEILKNDSQSIIAINNNALLSLYDNKCKESYNILNLIESPNQMDSYNECIHENIKILKQNFKADIQK